MCWQETGSAQSHAEDFGAKRSRTGPVLKGSTELVPPGSQTTGVQHTVGI